MRRLGARRDRPAFAFGDMIGTIADGENPVIKGGLQRRPNDKLVVAGRLQPADLVEEFGALHACRPHHDVGGDGFAIPGVDGIGRRRGHLRCGEHPHAKRFELGGRGGGEFFGQCRQDARPGLDQRHLQALFVEHLQPVKAQGRGGRIEFSRKLHPGCAAADDGNTGKGIGIRIGGHRPRHAQALVEQAAAEAIGIGTRIERNRVFAHPRRAEIIRHRSDRQHQIIVTNAVAADDFGTVLVENRRDDDLLRGAINAFERAIEIAIAPAKGMAAIADFIKIGIQ